jgi:hypothetical protein
MATQRTIRFEGATLYPKQRDAIYDDARISCIESSTKAGKTVGALAWIIEQGLRGKSGQNYWWIAPVYTQSEIAFRRCWNMLEPLKQMCKRNQSAFYITLPNATRIVFKSGERPDDLYGEDVYACVMDEASRMREESWHAIRSTLTATRGPVRIIGNVRGRKNWFYRLSRLAESGVDGMAFHRITAWDAVEAGVLAREEIEHARRDFIRLGQEDVFRQLYMAEALDDASNPFGLKAIEACLCDHYSPDNPIAAGVDLAGRGAVNVVRTGDAESRDWTAIACLDRNGNMTYLDRFRKPHRETQTEIVRRVGRTMAYVDSTGTGDVLVEDLQRRGDMRVLGYTFTDRSRQDLLEGLALALQSNSIHWPDFVTSDGKGSLRDELESFEFDYTPRGVRYNVPEGESDDLTMAVALAVKRMPWKRHLRTQPMNMPVGTSRWDGTGDTEAWRKYQEGKKPTVSDQEEKKVNTAMPFISAGQGDSKWSQAG